MRGAELETTWEPSPGLRFSFAGGYENATLNNGDRAIDLMDRTAGMPGWIVVKPFPTEASNCILPDFVVAAMLTEQSSGRSTIVSDPSNAAFACAQAYTDHVDPATLAPYVANPTGLGGAGFGLGGTFPIPAGYPGFDPTNPLVNNGQGFAKNLRGNKLPNSPPYTLSFTAEYTLPVWTDWAATLHGDFYWQGSSFARVFNDKAYDQIHGYTNVNLSLILNSADGWQVMGYVKNVFNTTAITGDFLNSDDSGLTTNVFLTDPRLFGVRVTKDFAEGAAGSYGVPEFLHDLFTDDGREKPTLWVEIGGQAEDVIGQGSPFDPAFIAANTNSSVLKNPNPLEVQRPTFAFGEDVEVTYLPPDSDWIFAAGLRIARSSNFKGVHHQTHGKFYELYLSAEPYGKPQFTQAFADTQFHHRESHMILDFTAGKDLGLGMLGSSGSSVLSGGLRFAQFSSRTTVDLRARPDVEFKYYPSAAAPVHVKLDHYQTYHLTGAASRSFHGLGPMLKWNASLPLAGDLPDGALTFDWGANGALLFGKQKTRVSHHSSGHYFSAFRRFFDRGPTTLYNRTASRVSERDQLVPNLGAFAGASYRIQNAKISLGYRADFFLGALDGGIDQRKSSTVGFMGPFANISIGLGG